MKPELKAFRHYRKNFDSYLAEMATFWGDDEKQAELYEKIASKFGASGKKLMEVCIISYEREVERAFR